MRRALLFVVFLMLFVGTSWAEEGSLFDQALAAKREGNWEEAIRLFETCIAQGERVLDALWEEGLLLVEQGKYRRAFELSEKAIPLFASHLTEHPEDHTSWFRLGYIFELRSSSGLFKEWQKAKECFEKALEYSPEDPFYLLHLGYVLYKMGEREKAEEILRGILREQPMNFEVRYWLAVVLESQGKYEEAREELSFLRDHAPGDFRRMKEVEKLLRAIEGKG